MSNQFRFKFPNKGISTLIGILIIVLIGIIVVGEGQNKNLENLNCTLLDYSNAEPGETATFRVKITNSTNETKSIPFLLATIFPSMLSPGAEPQPIAANLIENLKVPPGDIVTTINVQIPGYICGGEYLLRLYAAKSKEDKEPLILLEKPISIQSKLAVKVSLPEKIIMGENFVYKVKIKNINDKTIHAVCCILDTHYHFSSEEPLTKMGETTPKNIGDLLPGEEKEISWNLTPTDFGDCGIDTKVYSRDGGSFETTQNIHVLQPPHIWIKTREYSLGLNEESINITLSLYNSGDLPAEDITITLSAPPGVTIEKKEINVPFLNPKEHTETIPIKVSDITKSIVIIAKLEGSENLTGYLKEGSEAYIFIEKRRK